MTGKDAFYKYVTDCQIETTMPFNDYWTEMQPPGKRGWTLLGAMSVFVIIGLMLWPIWIAPISWLICGILVMMLLVAITLVLHWGTTPFPKAPDSDLPSVLKAIYVQQMFVGFSIDHLGDDDQALYDGFGEFLKQHQPSDLEVESQPAGVLRSDWRGS